MGLGRVAAVPLGLLDLKKRAPPSAMATLRYCPVRTSMRPGAAIVCRPIRSDWLTESAALRTSHNKLVIASAAKQSIYPLAETWIASLRSQ